MIPSFLRSMAAIIRQRAASGQTVYVTEATARELELLAVIFEENEPLTYWTSDEVRHEVTAPDIALGWLLCATPNYDGPICDNENVMDALDRVSVCAELAVMAGMLVINDHSYFQGPPITANPYEGTREGARAAWRFIAENPMSPEEGAAIARPMGFTSIHEFLSFAMPIIETYRRELEGMKS